MLQSPSDRARRGFPISPSRALQPTHLKAPSPGPGQQLWARCRAVLPPCKGVSAP